LTQRPQPLSGIRVVDFGQYLAGPLASLLLAENGADVIRVDPPGGPRWNHPANAVLHRSKRSMVLDLRDHGDMEVARDLVRDADVVIEGFRPGVMERLGLSADRCTDENPMLIWCALPGFGRSDPRSQVPGWEGLVSSAAGLYPPQMPNESTPAFDHRLERARVGLPRFSAVPMASSFAAAIAAHSIVAGLITRERTGRGDVIELPLFDAAFDAIGFFGENPLTVQQLNLNREQDLIVNPAFTGKQPYRCRDGRFVAQYGMPPSGLHKFFEAHLPAELKYKTDPESAQQVRDVLGPLFATRDAVEWELELQKEYGAVFATSQTTEQWLYDQDALDSDAVVTVDDPVFGRSHQAGFAVKLGTKPRVRFPRRESGADTEDIKGELRERRATGARKPVPSPDTAAPDAGELPLAGMRVVDFTALVAGPVGSRVLAEYGAEVIKINKAAIGWNEPDPRSDDAYAFFGHRTTGAGKRTMFVDLKSADGRKIAEELIRNADIVYTYGTDEGTEKLGLDVASVCGLNPTAIYSRTTAYGAGGWRHQLRGHEDVAEHVTGLAIRYCGGIPDEMHGVIVNDMGTGHFTALGVLLSVFDRLAHGIEGPSIVESSLAQTATFMQVPYMIAYDGAEWNEPAGAAALGWTTTDRLFDTSDGSMWVAAVGPDALERLLAATSDPAADVSLVSKDDAVSVLESRFRTRTGEAWVLLLFEHDIAAHVYCGIEAMMEHPIAKTRGLSIVRDHPGMGEGRDVGVIRRFRSRPDAAIAPSAAPGYHTREVLAELGYTDAQQDELFERRIVASDASYQPAT
jgi:crotonobetainyl-CoA:carnitine CoA-transferase CaiB-like acyl-CoA transferase